MATPQIMKYYVYNMALTGLADLWATDTINMAIIGSGITPSKDDNAAWGSGASVNYSTYEVTPGGNYPAGGVAITGNTVTTGSGIVYLNATSPVTITGGPSNPTGCYYLVFYSTTDATKRVLGYCSMTGPVSIVTGLQVKLNNALSGTQPIFQATM